MKINKITLRNGFKRFKDTTIDLGPEPKKIIALVGPNGSGKSSVFDGMLYLQNMMDPIGGFGPKDFNYHSMSKDTSFDSQWNENVEITFDCGRNFQEVYNERQTEGKPKTIFSFRGPHRHCSNLNITQLQKVPNVIENKSGASATIDLDDKITENYQRLYSLIDRKIKEVGTVTYNDAKAKIIGKLNAKLENVLGISIHDHGDILDGKGTLFFSKEDQEIQFDFNVLSSGEKEVVDILLDIYLRTNVFTDTIYIIDEPELHLNTSIQGKLLHEIVDMIPDTSQLWIATHSIGFLNTLKQDFYGSSDVIWFEGNFGSEVVNLDPMTKDRDSWRKVFRTALEDLTGLLAPKTIVYCEGRKEPDENGQEKGLDAEIYNSIFSEKYPDVLFVSSGGQDEPKKYSEIALLVLSKAFQNVNLLILRDKDINSDGTNTTNQQRSGWLAEDENHRMLARKEIENYLLDFEVIKKSFPNIEKDEYDKIIPDINASDVKEKASEVMELCNFNGRKSGCNDFKKYLAQKITSDMDIYKELEGVIFADQK